MIKHNPHYYGHRQRLRERFLKVKSEGFHDYELLELLLSYAIPRKDVKSLAKELLIQYKTISGVLDAPLSELNKVKGIGDNSLVLISLLKELFCKYTESNISYKEDLSSPEKVIDFVKLKIGQLSYEIFLIIFVDTQNRYLAYEIIHEGTLTHTIVYPRKIAEYVLRYNAGGMIIFHNHPNGNPFPSKDDFNLTYKLKNIFEHLDVSLLDHIIITKNDYYSFKKHEKL